MSYIMEEIAKTNFEMGLEQGERRIIRLLCKNKTPAQVAEELNMPLDKVVLILEAEE